MRKVFTALAGVICFTSLSAAGADGPQMTVYKTPTCGCCVKWVAHLEANGFQVTTRNMDDLAPIKSANRVPRRLTSCHTGVVEGYVIEGHIPADLILKLLRETPAVAGLAVPGMPIGSPGMEAGDRKQPYQVLSFDADGMVRVYATR